MKNDTNDKINSLSDEELLKKLKKCPITMTMETIGGKWKPIILSRIKLKINRFGQLERTISGISKKMLTAQLRELEQSGIIDRVIYAEIPPRVEYFISKKGETLFPILDSMFEWGKSNIEDFQNCD